MTPKRRVIVVRCRQVDRHSDIRWVTHKLIVMTGLATRDGVFVRRINPHDITVIHVHREGVCVPETDLVIL